MSGENAVVLDPRELFDEHRDMRLDIDDMSYEVSSNLFELHL
jgi:hypothetical protein